MSVQELKKKSEQSTKFIEKLKHQIEQIKLSSTPEYIINKTNELKKENADLKSKVEKLKNDLEEAEKKTGKKATINISDDTQKDKKTTKQPQQQQPQSQDNKKSSKNQIPDNIDISALDIRVGKIVKVGKHPDADSLYVEEIDLGEDKPRVVCSGLVKFIPIEQMENQLVVCICNLKPAKMRGILSEAMVLCASTPEKVELIQVPEGTQIGDRVTAASQFIGSPVAECNPKNNIFGLVAVDLKTNDSLVATYKDVILEIKGKGPLRSSTLKNVPVK
jgi:aminoacyl tRNA synthase complex-interacting multifunctional protein 1